MKKLLSLLAIAMVASTASAATFKWSSDAISFGSEKVKKNATGYLVFIGSNTLGSEGYAWDDILGMSTIADSATSSLSKVAVDPVDSGSNNVGNFVMYATYVSDSKTYYNVSSSVYTITQEQYNALINEGTALADTSFAFASTVNAADAPGSIGDGWFLKQVTPDPIPEPATGALALAGIALLFKRRRA